MNAAERIAAAAPEIRRPDGARHDYVSLCLADAASLETVMRAGVLPDLEKLSGWEFRGYNTPDLMSVLGIRKFKKGFFRDARTPAGHLGGYNVKTRQSPLGAPWVDVTRGADSFKFGWYDVRPVDLAEPHNKYPNAVLIDYDVDRNPALDPTRLLRDYLSQVYADNPDLYLGKAYLALGPMPVYVSWFVLERSNRSSLAG